MIGRDFSHYRVLERLGGGGMGVVFRARDTRLERTVALKFLPAEWSQEPVLRERFSREARASSSLDHPHICTIFDIGETPEGQLYIAMGYYPGETLKQRILRGTIPIEEAIEFTIQIAEGLAAAHEAGVVHRDIKPANILITDRSQIRIVDFGLAKLAGEVAVTREGSVVGTPAYMSPEQATGDEVDGRSDIWALGAVFYEMLAGRRAFAADHERAILLAITSTDPTPVDHFRPEVPAEIQRIIRRCLKRDPEARYQNARQLVSDLRRFRGESTPAEIVTQTLPSVSRIRRKNIVTHRLLPILAAIGVVIGVATLWPTFRQRPTIHLAVLPFDCDSGNQETATLCEGMLDTLTAKLTELRQFDTSLSVVPMSEIRALKIRSAGDAYRVFGVDLVLTGSVQREKDNLRIPLQLIDAAELRQTRSHLIVTGAESEFGLQDEVIAAVEDLLEIELAPAARRALEAGGTSDAEAAEIFLRARGTVTAVPTEENLTRAMALYRNALDRDPRYADAMVELAHLCLNRWQLNEDSIWLEHGVSYARRAVELDPDLPGAHLASGRCELARHSYPEAIARFERAIELDPLQLDAYTDLATAYQEMGNGEMASSTIERAVRTGPDDWQTHLAIGRFYLFDQSDPLRAAESFRMLIELNPESAIGYAALGASLFYAGDRSGARENLERAVEIGDLYWALSNLATLEFYEQNHAAAEALYRRALAIDDGDFQVWNNLAEASRAAGGSEEQIRDAYAHAAELASARLEADPGNVTLLINLASFAAHLGDRTHAIEHLARIEELGVQSAELMFFTADAYERVGDRGQALSWVGRALEAGFPAQVLVDYHDFDDLRADPRYEELTASSTTE